MGNPLIPLNSFQNGLYGDASEASRQKMSLFEESEAAERLPERPCTPEQVRDSAWWPPEAAGTSSG
jgi:hypothetical protein